MASNGDLFDSRFGKVRFGHRLKPLYTFAELCRCRAVTMVILANLQKYEDAIAVGREVTALHEKAVGPDHMQTVTSRANLCYMLMLAGSNIEEVLETGQGLADQLSRILGEQHTGTTRFASMFAAFKERSSA